MQCNVGYAHFGTLFIGAGTVCVLLATPLSSLRALPPPLHTPFPHRLHNKILAFYFRTDCVAQLSWGEARRGEKHLVFNKSRSLQFHTPYTVHHISRISHIHDHGRHTIKFKSRFRSISRIYIHINIAHLAIKMHISNGIWKFSFDFLTSPSLTLKSPPPPLCGSLPSCCSFVVLCFLCISFCFPCANCFLPQRQSEASKYALVTRGFCSLWWCANYTHTHTHSLAIPYCVLACSSFGIIRSLSWKALQISSKFNLWFLISLTLMFCISWMIFKFLFRLN